jgi:hypothetical protein
LALVVLVAILAVVAVPAAAAGAVVVHGEDGSSQVVLFGSDTMFRSHPRGLFPQPAHALWWSGSN